MKNNKYIQFILYIAFVFVILKQNLVAQNNEATHFIHYTTEEGLPSSYVKSIVQDSDGYIWAATRNALVRFDGKTFREFPAYDEDNKPTKIFCYNLMLTNDSVLVAVTNNGIYYYYNSNKEAFYQYKLLTNLGPSNNITPVEGGFWVFQNNKIFFINKKTGKRQSLKEKTKLFQLNEKTNYIGFYIKDEWIVFSTSKTELFSYNILEKKFRKHNLPKGLNPTQFDLRFIDSHNNLWISSFDHGVAKLNLENNSSSFFSKKNIPNSNNLPHDLIHCFTEDKLGRVWLGTENGLMIYSLNNSSIDIHNFKLSEPSGLNSNPIYSSFCDKDGNVWLGTYSGGINLWDGEKKFFNSWSSGFNKWQITGNIVSSLTEDSQNNLWIGMEDKGVNKLNTKTGEVTQYTSKGPRAKLSYDNVHDILFANDHELWIATYTGGINVLNTKTNTIQFYNRENSGIEMSSSIYQFYKHKNVIYIATASGIDTYNLTEKKFKKLKSETIGTLSFQSISFIDNILWFSSINKIFKYNPDKDSIEAFELIPEIKNINFVKTDSKSQIWIGDCYKGLVCYNPKKKTIRHFNSDNGFPANWIFSMEEGNNGWYWASTDKGLIKFSPENNKHILFDNNSGISFNQFNFRASYKDHKGTIYFGGNNGIILFDDKLKPIPKKPKSIVFTGFQLFNKEQSPLDSTILNKSIDKTNRIELKYDENVFTIEFSAFCYNSKGQCKYIYYLEGFEKEWNNVSNRDFATYTNLSPGTYTFKVKALLNANQDQSEERQITIVVNPPFWLSKWAYIIYVLIIISIFILVFKIGEKIEKSKALAQLEHKEKVHADEIHRVKLEFFTNISHELKTPLTLILGPLKKIMDDEKLNPSLRKQLIGIERNTNRLFLIIKQLLEFRKIESGNEKLNISSCNVLHYMEDISKSFNDLADSKDIQFELDFPKANKIAWLDENKVDKIIFNLLSNAFKFTPEGGKILFLVEFKKQNPLTSTEVLIIKVVNTGKGIKPEMLEKVFDQFFQVENMDNNQGSGIGLAYVKSLVHLHKGNIKVESEENKETSFVVELPVSKENYCENEISDESVQYNRNRLINNGSNNIKETIFGENELINSLDQLSSKPLVLIVEDNIELINFLKESLELKYRIATAQNGKIALEKLENITPELIISDVMMPEMDGIQLTNKLKGDIKLSHIPIILLTSKTGPESKLEGLQSGADYYIEKPFYAKILEQNIENILNTRKSIIERFKTDDYINAEDITYTESDKIFIEKLTEFIKSNINNSEIDVTSLIKEMGVSRSLLHMKLKGLTGCSSTEFIRAIRLKEAVKLISSGKCNISQAAYETGFSSPTYFTRCFRDFYGKSPKEYFGK